MTKITQPRAAAWPGKALFLIRNFHNHVVLFRVGDWILVTYGLVAATAFFAGFSAGLWYDAMTGQDPGSKARFYAFLVLPAVLFGARAFSVLLEWKMLFRQPIKTLVKPGYMLHGGLAGGLTAFLLWSISTGASLPLLLDSAAFAMPLGEALCRLGCYVYGCCWGKPTRNWAGIRYESPDAKVVRHAPELRGVRIHPVQLYGLVAHLVQFSLFYTLLPYKSFDGMFAALYCLTHPAMRFVLERFRSDDRGRLFGPFTHTHLYSSVQFAIGAFGLIYWRMAGANTPLDIDVPWTAAIANPFAALVALIILVFFGVHFGSVGAWLPQPPKWSNSVGVAAAGVTSSNRVR